MNSLIKDGKNQALAQKWTENSSLHDIENSIAHYTIVAQARVKECVFSSLLTQVEDLLPDIQKHIVKIYLELLIKKSREEAADKFSIALNTSGGFNEIECEDSFESSDNSDFNENYSEDSSSDDNMAVEQLYKEENSDVSLWPRMKKNVSFLISERKVLLQEVIEQIYDLFKKNYSFLHIAADMSDRPGVVDFINVYCADQLSIGEIDRCVFQRNPLIAAIECKSLEAVETLMQAGASLEVPEAHYNPLSTAIISSKNTIIFYLLSCINSIDQKTKNKQNTPLHLATYTKNKLLVSALLRRDKSALLETVNVDKQTPLLSAIDVRAAEIAELLLKANANPNCKNQHNDYALSIALNDYKNAVLLKNDWNESHYGYYRGHDDDPHTTAAGSAQSQSLTTLYRNKNEHELAQLRKIIELLIEDPRTNLEIKGLVEKLEQCLLSECAQKVSAKNREKPYGGHALKTYSSWPSSILGGNEKC
ncbi:ankyrin repeat domain-containing protein [Candidatus Dependentiae bacterium]|nr:ankyrin repeat domain-containing protein [Candidatus Dependentiae bacterium]